MKKACMGLSTLFLGLIISTSVLAQDKVPEFIYVDNIVNNTTMTISAVVLQGETRTISPNTSSGPMTFKFFRPNYVFWMKLTDVQKSQMCALIQVTNYKTPNYVVAGNFNCGISVTVNKITDDHYALNIQKQ